MEIASVSLTGGKKVPVRKEDKGPDVLGQDHRDAIDLANQTVHDVATVRNASFRACRWHGAGQDHRYDR